MGLKRTELITEDPKSIEIIKPLLRGRDIQKYYPDYQDLWLIYIPWHFPLHKDRTTNNVFEKAENEFKINYPAIYNHLLQHKSQLLKRNKAEVGIRYEWYALQRFGSNYWQDFNKSKIIYPNMTKFLPFILDLDGYYYHNDRSFHLITDRLYWLGAFFNSKLFDYCFRENFPGSFGWNEGVKKSVF